MIGAVLAGGRSTRLGRDKTRLRLPGDERDMLARTAALLAACTDEAVVSCRAGAVFGEAFSYRLVPDIEEGLGPFGGVWSLLRAVREPVLVLSCDLPFMDAATLRRLVEVRAARPAEALMTTYQQIETGYIEALTAIYEPACLPFFEEARRRGVRRINLVIPPERQARIPYARDAARPFFNINFPADLERALSLTEAAALPINRQGPTATDIL